MSNSLSECCNPCATTPPVNVPGAQGPQGIPGTNGTDGAPAYSIVTVAFVIPTLGNDVIATVDNTLWMTVGQTVIGGQHFGGPATGPANFTVITLNSATTVTLRALVYPGDAVNPASIAAGGQITAAGLRGATGAAGAAGSVFPTTTAGDTMYNTDGVAAHAARLGIGQQGQGYYADPSNGTPANIISWKGSLFTLNANITTISTGADLTEDNLMGFLVPANALRNVMDAIMFEAVFDVFATAVVATKTIKFKYGGSTVLQFGSAALNGGSVLMRGLIVRVNATAQIAFCDYMTTDGAAASTTLVQRVSPAETLANAIQIQCTGQNGTNAVAGGITQQYLWVGYRAGS